MTAFREQPSPRRPSRAVSITDAVWAGILAAALLPLTTVEIVRSAGPGDGVWAACVITLFVLAHLTVTARRRWPRSALAIASGVMLALTVASAPGTPTIAVLLPSSLVYLAVVYWAAASDQRYAGLAAAVLGMVGAALITAVAVAHDFGTAAGPVVALAGFLVASVGAAWAAGRYRRESSRKQAAQQLALEQATALRAQADRERAADERRRIGREVHDVVSHSLAVMVAQAEASRVLLGRDDARARVAIENVVATGRTALGDMRGLLGVLAEPAESADPAAPAPRAPSPTLTDLRALVERAGGPDRVVELVEKGEPRTTSPVVALTAYRVVQESLTNTLTHTAAPTRSEVRLDWADALEVTVTDDGSAPGDRAGQLPGRGIRGMQERVIHAGGRFENGPVAGGGWSTWASFPTADASALIEHREGS